MSELAVKVPEWTFPQKMALPFYQVGDAALDKFIERFKQAKNITILAEESKSQKVLLLELQNEDALQEMVKLIETPLD